jgi:hypothetical protein
VKSVRADGEFEKGVNDGTSIQCAENISGMFQGGLLLVQQAMVVDSNHVFCAAPTHQLA